MTTIMGRSRRANGPAPPRGSLAIGSPFPMIVLSVVMLVVAGCAAPQSMAGPTPTGQPATSAPTPAEPAPTRPPGGSPTTPPTTPPATPPPPPATTPPDVPSPIPEPGASWRYLADFPAGEAAEVASVVASERGFVAVGSQPASGEAVEGIRQGIVWASPDGVTWRRDAGAMFHGASLANVVEFGEELYLFGFVSTCPLFDDDCPTASAAGNAAWRGAPGGSWTPLSLPASLRDAVIDGVAVAGGELVVRGIVGEEPEQTLWLSDDGGTWRAVTEVGGIDFISAVGEGRAGIVALGTVFDVASDTIETRAAWSADGRAFRTAAVPAGLAVSPADVANGRVGLVAVGNDVSRGQVEAGGAVLLSEDGSEWAVAGQDTFAGVTLGTVHSVPNGYLALGALRLPADRDLLLGSAWQSNDGTNWRPLAAMEQRAFHELSAAAVGDAGVVVFGVELADDRSITHAWFAPSELFAGD